MRNSLLGGILLVAGTAIGGGMLGLPVLTSLGGFLPSIFIYIACWLFMCATGLLFLEISLWLGKDANILTMAETTLGKYGRAFAWVLYLFLFYCLTLAYIVACGDFISQIFGFENIRAIGSILFVLIFGSLVIMGPRIVSTVNGILVIAMSLLFLAFIVIGTPYINIELLQRKEWLLSLFSLPVAFVAFAYQGIIPTLVSYFDRDLYKTRLSIIVGSSIPLIIYIIWQGLILGIIPTFGPGGLLEALKNGQNAVTPLSNFINNPFLITIGNIFAFLALLTSFFGVTLGLVDFLADGLKISNKGWSRVLLGLMVFIPPLLVALWKEHVFLIALDLAGGYGAALLLGLLPILMVWSGRYKLNFKDGPYRLWGGKPLLIGLFLFVCFELICQIMITIGAFDVSKIIA